MKSSRTDGARKGTPSAVPRPGLPASGQIVVLNGASSAGKSCLAQALQATLPGAYLHVQLDAFRAMEPPEYFSGLQPGVRTIRVAALCRAMNAAIAEYARHGQNVLLDHVLPPEGWQYLAQDLAGYRLLTVGVRCSPEVLEARERSRGDRRPGLALSQAHRVHADRDYDFEVDTTHCTAVECAAQVRRWLECNPHPKPIAALEQQLAAI